MIAVVVTLAVLGALGLLLGGAYLLLRNPELERENRQLKAQNGQWGALLGRLRGEDQQCAALRVDVSPRTARRYEQALRRAQQEAGAES